VIKVNVHDAKTHLSRYLDKVEAGEVVVLCRHNKPVAEMRAIEEKKTRRRFGVYEGQMHIPGAAFFDPLPADIQKYFDGEGEE
jgi:antitoxin (DNA-binding transcriptional repressor) of toxin-antitoxin stability system